MMTTTLRKCICLLLVVLFAAAALTGCSMFMVGSKTDAQTEQPQGGQETVPATQNTDPVPEGETTQDPNAPVELGEGEKLIYFDVTFSDGSTASYAIHTDADTVGEALVGEDLIAGEDSQYGLYVKTVGGETLDWETDGMYWAFYENGEYAMTGVDLTEITDGSTYSFVATKG